MEETVAWTTRRHEYPLHEPAGTARGFGVRQSSGAFGSGPRAQKRQRTAAVQDASAPAAASSRFMAPMHAPKRREALHKFRRKWDEDRRARNGMLEWLVRRIPAQSSMRC